MNDFETFEDFEDFSNFNLKLHSFCNTKTIALKNTVWRHLTKLSLILIQACYWPKFFRKPSNLNLVPWKIAACQRPVVIFQY